MSGAITTEAKEIILIANPTSGAGVTKRAANQVLRALRSQGYQVRPVISPSPQGVIDFVAGLPAEATVAALGGDGFIRLVAAGALKSGVLLAPLPGGRGNDFCRYLGVPHTDPVEAALALPLARETHVDVGMAGEEPFLGVGTVGFSSVANNYANEEKILKGAGVYAMGAVKALLGYRVPQMRIVADGDVIWDGKAWEVDVGNSGRFGGGMQVCPHASLTDGLLDITIFTARPRLLLLPLLRKVFSGDHINSPYVQTFQGRDVEIEVDREGMRVYGDGDDLGPVPTRIRVIAKALRVLA